MTLTDWIINLALIAMVFSQLHAQRMSWFSLAVPLGIVGWVASSYLHAFPTGGADLALVGGATAVGLALGAAAGLMTRVYPRGDRIMVRATLGAAFLWLVGCGVRLAFQLFMSNGGAETIGRFSVEHHIDVSAWTTAVVLMAIAQVLSRTALVGWRGRQGLVRRQGNVPAKVSV
ncbi:hypothetical protein QF026_007542 [Streptomyces aurantiacus]|uniref:hypothetical protein n=1 Tax=Streptomyces aurantiacus TaxID=47760 RepID=UPI00279458F1|nr:hypothetical protein [Streptomyces aurantiacus]MDQ0779076.1 hypothetical protein [Streptomyces aurantiacus]